MFTGIIDHCGTILKTESLPSGVRLTIQTRFQDFEMGESIAINGICLTVTQFDKDSFCSDLSPETLQVTTARDFKPNQIVNLERALLLSSRLGGHFVAGHIDQVCIVKTIRKIDDFIEMTFSGLDDSSRLFVIKKGSISINGVSLTINHVTENEFSVMLIPHTIERTQLRELRENDAVNIEFDMMARIIAEQSKLYKK